MASLVSCLVNIPTINLRSVLKWICGKEGIERKNYFGYSINLFWLWDHPPHFKTTAVQESRSKKWLSNYCDGKSCPRTKQYFPVLAGSPLSLKITKWICWVETYEEPLNPEHYSLRKHISPEPSFLKLSNNTLMFGLVITGSTQPLQRILQCISNKWLQFRTKPSVSLYVIIREKR